MIILTHFKLSDEIETEKVIIGSYPVSVQGLLDAVKASEAIKHEGTRLSAEMHLFGQSLLVSQLAGTKSLLGEEWPIDPSEPVPMSVPERAAMIFRLAQVGELSSFLRNEAAYNSEQAVIRGTLYYQGFMGDPIDVAPGFHGNAQFWYDFGKKNGDEFDSRQAA
jgi:hypothetical protein